MSAEFFPTPEILLEPGTLWDLARQTTQQALNCGALEPIDTESEYVDDGNIRFLVRVLPSLIRKDQAKAEQQKSSRGKDFNPFLPYDEKLFVAELSETHVCLLNKYNVMDHHLLIVTRAFEAQDSLITLQDFTALWACLAQMDGLAFYNAGTIAGASQRHKHLQLVPLPLLPQGPAVPIEAAIATAQFSDGIGISPDLPFLHTIAPLDPDWANDLAQAGQLTCDRYQTLLKATHLWHDSTPKAYNLLATRRWMMVIPRTAESFGEISVNALGFAGTFLARNEQQLNQIKAQGPLALLKTVAISMD